MATSWGAGVKEDGVRPPVRRRLPGDPSRVSTATAPRVAAGPGGGVSCGWLGRGGEWLLFLLRLRSPDRRRDGFIGNRGRRRTCGCAGGACWAWRGTVGSLVV